MFSDGKSQLRLKGMCVCICCVRVCVCARVRVCVCVCVCVRALYASFDARAGLGAAPTAGYIAMQSDASSTLHVHDLVRIDCFARRREDH